MMALLASALPTEPLDQGSFAWKLYKAGHLVPAIILAAFFALTYAQNHITWLRVGYRKVAVAAGLSGLGMLAERVANGTTPNATMIMGAIGAALAMALNTKGEPKPEAPAS